MSRVLVAGVGSTPFGRLGRDPESLAVEAALMALLDAGIERHRVGALYLGNFAGGVLSGQEVLAALTADALGLPQVPCTKVEGACASGGIAFRHAWMAVASGACDVALAIGVEAMTHAASPVVTAALGGALDQTTDGLSGLTFPGVFALAWQAYASRHGAGRADLSAVVRKNRAAGLRNPLASRGAALDDAAIEASPLICDPLRLLDCCPMSDGAAAAVLVSGTLLREVRAPVAVRAAVQTRGGGRIGSTVDPCSFEATMAAARQAYAAAGVAAGDLDFVELHDCFSAAELIDAEDLGLVPRGAGGAYAREGRTSVGGDRPVNPSGGLLAKGHPVGATGLGQVHEAVLQLRGEHPNPVRDARLGMTHNLGGLGAVCTVSILERLT